MAFAATVTRAQWIRLGILFLVAIGFSVGNWQWRLRQERVRFENSLAELRVWDRQTLCDNWHDWDDLPAVKWEPSMAADKALAVIPRRGRLKKDAIYLLWKGQRVTALIAVTEIGNWVRGERKDLDELVGMLKARGANAKLKPEQKRINGEAIAVAEKKE
ncbi:hypothetical protein LLG95_01555 [bacterium]|nr:hypothetical protein [bacterium]